MPNRLRDESSPYLLQHADNPVDWYPWNDEAIAAARSGDRPILLSVGYSACHWCHVMAHESFEDPATADLMNSLYVNIKVDREERPDIDRIYQLAQQMFTGRPGGWPLTMFLTPDSHLPIFAGTYFPKTARYGMPAFADVLRGVEAWYRSHPAEVAENGTRLKEHFGRLDAGAAVDTPTAEPIAAARARLGEHYDAAHGGFGGAPKFPHANYVDLLLAQSAAGRRSGADDAGAATMIRGTLDAMAAGGLYDHVGGGFFRYCVDAGWTIPHFEKMLYDNAALLGTYADAHAATGDDRYARVAIETAGWLQREMRSPDGAFFATLDADSDGEEGRYYVFAPDELDALPGNDLDLAKRCFGLDGPPNFEGRAWHLQFPSVDAWRAARDADRFEHLRATLRAERDRRARPARDEKILAAWNGLAAAALARAARRLDRPALLGLARDSIGFVRSRMFVDGRLFAVHKDGRSRFPAYLDDYAFVLAAVIELLQADFRTDELAFARALADATLAHFADPAGGCFFTADDQEQLIHRPKPLTDDALPSGNAVLAIALTTLGHLLAEPRYLDAADLSVRAAWTSLSRYPEAHATYLRALDLTLSPPTLVVARGLGAETGRWRETFDRNYFAGRFAFLIPADDDQTPALDRFPPTSGFVAYLCTGTECSAPIHSLEALQAALGEAR